MAGSGGGHTERRRNKGHARVTHLKFVRKRTQMRAQLLKITTSPGQCHKQLQTPVPQSLDQNSTSTDTDRSQTQTGYSASGTGYIH